jgi:uncharacterized protein YggE
MMKRVAILSLALLPVGASAQGLPQQPVPASGITVQGHGSVRVPVKTLQFVAVTRGNVDEASVLAALRAAGVVDPSMGPLGAQVSANAPTVLRGTIPVASSEKLEHIVKAAGDYVHEHPGTTVESISFAPQLDDCAAAEQAARTTAFSDARRKGEAIAALAGLSIDGVRAVTETAGCPVPPEGPQFGQSPGFDLGALTTSVSVTDTVTFAVGPAATGARRRTL